MKTDNQSKLWLVVIAVAAGYFVDLYDLLLFSSIRTVSLKELNITGELATQCTTNLMNFTVGGMLIGGFFWGFLSDIKGRKSVLYASILVYSLANVYNAFIHDIFHYQLCRFFAGFGLAGELGVGMTLVSELLPNNKRTKAGMIITVAGMLGAVFAGILTYLFKDTVILSFSSWRFLFLLGAVFGFALLIFRKNTIESSLFSTGNSNNLKNLISLLGNGKRLIKYSCCFLAGLPVFFIIGNYVTLSPEYAKEFGITTINPALSVMFCYSGVLIFDLLGNKLSMVFKTRKKILIAFLLLQVITIAYYLYVPTLNQNVFYFKIFLLGAGAGYWGVLILNSLEQFGTNLRSTITTTVPNIIRGSLIPLSIYFFNPIKPSFGLINSGAIVGFTSIIIAFFAVIVMEDRFENDLTFQEE